MISWVWLIVAVLVTCLSIERIVDSPTSVFQVKGNLANSTSMALYEQFVLFGDSLFQHSSSQDRGFSLAAALQAGRHI